MADLLRIRAVSDGDGFSWKFMNDEMSLVTIELADQPMMEKISPHDVWYAELVDRHSIRGSARKKVTLRLVARLLAGQEWMNITELPDHWIEPDKLRAILIWLHAGSHMIFAGPKGSGKTTLAYALARALGWQEPCKVDVYTVRRTTDFFGIEAAKDSSTHFRPSALMSYIERARIAADHGVDTTFVMLFDEINRVHANANESLHGLFDDTGQITVNTTEGPKIIRLPKNIRGIGTMNVGAQYLGTHGLDEALRDRFAMVPISHMPFDEEVKRLTVDTRITADHATKIVRIAQALREASDSGLLVSYSPSFRACRRVAQLLFHGMLLRQAISLGFLSYYQGRLDLDERGVAKNPDEEVAKAYSAIRMTLPELPTRSGSRTHEAS